MSRRHIHRTCPQFGTMFDATPDGYGKGRPYRRCDTCRATDAGKSRHARAISVDPVRDRGIRRVCMLLCRCESMGMFDPMTGPAWKEVAP